MAAVYLLGQRMQSLPECHMKQKEPKAAEKK
jgi:hypothetical protein